MSARFPAVVHHGRAQPLKTHYLIYFITGNPGLISFYIPFLSHLNSLLQDSRFSTKQDVSFDVFGRSLSGFEVDRATRSTPYSLEEQINNAEDAAIEFVKSVRLSDSSTRVILMGHSVGTYIMLEILRRQRLKAEGLDVRGGVCLFPTIVDLAGSPSGEKVRVSYGSSLYVEEMAVG